MRGSGMIKMKRMLLSCGALALLTAAVTARADDGVNSAGAGGRIVYDSAGKASRPCADASNVVPVDYLDLAGKTVPLGDEGVEFKPKAAPMPCAQAFCRGNHAASGSEKTQTGAATPHALDEHGKKDHSGSGND